MVSFDVIRPSKVPCDSASGTPGSGVVLGTAPMNCVRQAWRTQFMGAVPNTTPLPGVPLALSQGTFDGLITSNETIVSGQFWESGVRHGLEDHQFMAIYVPMISLDFWRKLTAEHQAMMTGLWGA